MDEKETFTRNEKLKAERASETEEQSKEMLSVDAKIRKQKSTRNSAWPLSKY